MARIIIFGGQGYLGKNIIYQFTGSHEILTLDRDIEKRFKDLEYQHVGLTDPELINILNDFHPNIFIVSYFGNPREGQKKFYTHLIDSIVSLVSRILSKPKIIFFSSQLVYGNTHYELKQEDQATDPIEFYPKMCLLMESKLFSQFPSNFLILRVPIVYGGLEVEKGYRNIVSYFVSLGRLGKPLTIFGEGSSVRSFIHLHDLIVLLGILISSDTKKEIVNACFGEYYTSVELAEYVRDAFPGVSMSHVPWPKDKLVAASYDIMLDSIYAKSLFTPRYILPDYLDSVNSTKNN